MSKVMLAALLKAKKATPKKNPKFDAVLKRRHKPLSRVIRAWLKAEARRVAAIAVAEIHPAQKVNLARALQKSITQKQLDEIIEVMELNNMRLLAGIITENTAGVYQEAFAEGAAVGGLSVDMTLVSEHTELYAQTRSAEMVGMVMAGGKMVVNPNSAWSITETTRTLLRAEIEKAIAAGSSARELAKAIEENYAFSDTRASNIARTELSNAFNSGSIAGWKNSGVKVKKQSLLGDLHDVADVCDEAALRGAIPLDEDFVAGYSAPAYHPNCVCSVVPVVEGKVKKVDLGALLKGDKVGHPFRGNQHTGGKSGVHGATITAPENLAVGAGRQKAFAKQMMDAIKSGGFTFTTSGSVQKTGYAVGEFPKRSLAVPEGRLTKNLVKQWLEKNKDILSTGKYRIGGWDDTKGATKKYWFDIVTIYPNTRRGRARAIESGKRHMQEGIMRLDDLSYVELGLGGVVKADMREMLKAQQESVASHLILFDNLATADEIYEALTGDKGV